MRRGASRNDPLCIATSRVRRQLVSKSRDSALRLGGSVRARNVLVVVTAAALSVGIMGGGRATGQVGSKEQCSLAVVSRLAERDGPVCDLSMVRRMAKNGSAFEQNQLGIASILAIGPDYSEKEALAWFQRAAQRGYAPAEVNLAVMYINGWGAPVNYGAGLHWLQTAAHQHFARAYYNL